MASVVCRKRKTHICDTQRSQIVSLVLAAAHPLAATLLAVPHVRRHVRAFPRAESARSLAQVYTGSAALGGALLTDRRNRALERTPGCEMLAATDTALDLLVLELIFQVASVDFVLLRVLAPVRAGPEYDVLADGGGVWEIFRSI